MPISPGKLGFGVAVGVVILAALYTRQRRRRRMESPSAPPSLHPPSSAPSSWLSGLLSFFGRPTAEELDPALAASNFALNFESTYGPTHPTFLECSFHDALKKARTDFKFLLVYLHSSLHDDTVPYCTGVLTAPMVVDFIDDNFLMWAGDLSVSEPYRVSTILSACRYPFIGVLSNVDGTPAIIERIEGLIDSEELLRKLATILETQGPALIAARASVEERERDRLLREEQEEEYLQALREDEEKEQRQAEEERRRLEEDRAREEEARRVEEEERARVTRRQTELNRKRNSVPPEPREGESKVCNVAIRLPDGSRLTRKFRQSDTLQALYDFVDVNEVAGLEIGGYDLVSNYPRKVHTDTGSTLEAAGLGSQCLLFVQQR